MPGTRLNPFIGVLAAAVVLWTGAHVACGWTSGDEGWYLYAAREVLRGHLPYFDFFFTQGPFTPLLMAPAMVVAPTLWTARVESALLFLLAMVLGAMWLRDASGGPDSPKRKGPGDFSSIWWMLLFGLSAFVVYMCTLALTTVYELLAACLTLVLLQRERRGWAVVVAALACAVRVSLAPWALAVWLFAAWTAPAPRASRALGLALVGAGLTVLAYAPFAVAAPERLWTGLFGYHLGGGRLAFSAERVWIFRRFFWTSWITFCWPALAAIAAGYAATLRRIRWDRWDALLLGGALALTIVHSLPSTPYPKYQVTPNALLALAASRRLAWVQIRPLLFVPLLFVLLPWQFVYYQYAVGDLAWPPAPARHHAAGRMIAGLARGEPVLTFETLLAVEGGLRVPPGYEMGAFSLTVSWDDARARRVGTVTPAMVTADLESARYRVLALHIDDLGLASAEWRDRAAAAIERNYRQVAAIPRIGHYQSTLFVFIRRNGD